MFRMNELAALIRRTRVLSGLSQPAAAEQAAVSQQTWAAWETGTRIPSIKRIGLIADVLGLTQTELADLHPKVQAVTLTSPMVVPSEDADPIEVASDLATFRAEIDLLRIQVSELTDALALLLEGGDDELLPGDPRGD